MNIRQTLRVATAVAVLGGALTVASAHDMAAGRHAYQTGGVGHEEAAEMARHMKDYNLHLTFSEGRHNAYLADVKVDIYNAAGKDVFSLKDAGPLTGVNLPAGHYRVVAEAGGITRSRSVDLKHGHPADLYLHWPKDPAIG